MMNIIGALVLIICAYLIGSFPTAYVFVKIVKRTDIREHGSGNVGATNAARVIGKGPALVVFVIDFLKGTITVTLLPYLLSKLFFQTGGFGSHVVILSGAAVIAGHIWTIFLKFKGGKGVATTAGVMAGLAPVILLFGLIVWIIIFIIWHYVSLASLCAAVLLPVLSVILGKNLDFVIFSSVLCLVGVYAHRLNIKRLIQGNEKKLR